MRWTARLQARRVTLPLALALSLPLARPSVYAASPDQLRQPPTRGTRLTAELGRAILEYSISQPHRFSRAVLERDVDVVVLQRWMFRHPATLLAISRLVEQKRAFWKAKEPSLSDEEIIRKIGLIFGFLEISFGLGSAFGSWIGGYLFDVTGSYAWPLAVCLLCFTISGLAIHGCIQWQAKHMAHNP